MRPLDIRSILLDGTICIEASAGTGKTFTIALIVLRLVMEKALDLRKLAVVTFTEAATDELSERIAGFLRVARDYAAGGVRGEGHEDLLELVDAAKTTVGEQVVHRLDDALINFDLARISTIHGFCTRVLDEFAFETKTSFGTEVLQNQQELIDEILADFWRKEIAPLEPRLSKFLGRMTPRSLRGSVSSFLAFPGLEVVDPPIGPGAIEEFCTAYDAMARSWKESREWIVTILTEDSSRFKQNSYNVSKIPLFADELDQLFVVGKIDEKKMLRFSSKSLAGGLKKGTKYSIPDIPFVRQIGAFIEKFQLVPECIEAAFVTRAYRFLVEELKVRQRAQRLRSFDAMIRDLADALRGGGEATAAVIRSGFSAVLVDEFQDTDPLQYEIFHRLFQNQEGVFFAVIGDPKQAIYRFRGGDIQAYVRARNSVPESSRFTICNNYRSEARLVETINRIYSLENPVWGEQGPFLDKEIGYITVSAKRNLAPPEQGGEVVPPVILWNAPDGEKPDEWVVGRRIADAVAGFMDPANPLMLGPAAHRRMLRLGDIAVLVGSHRLAGIFKEVLGESGIRSVVGKSGSILLSDEADLVALCLEAILSPSREKTVRALLYSRLYWYDIDALAAWEASDSARTATLDMLSESRSRWMKEGVASALDFMLSRTSGFSLSDDAANDLLQERRITNLRHLIELLHAEELRTGRNPERLLNAYRNMRAEGADAGNEEMEQRLESDYDAVQIITMHKSKGLQWPVVFAPDLAWDGVPRKASVAPICFDGTNRKADLDPKKYDDIEEKVHRELRQERMRIAYVTLTRAESLLVAVTANLSTPETPDLSPAALLLCLPHLGTMRDETGPLTLSEDLVPINSPRRFQWRDDRSGERPLLHWDIGRKVIPRWTVGSYTSLTHDVVHEKVEAEPDLTPPEGIFAFPKGPDAGTALHSVFERIDFATAGRAGEPPSAENFRLIEGILTDAGLHAKVEPGLVDCVMGMVQRVLHAPIPAVGPDFRLSCLSGNERLEELEFHLAAAHPDSGKTPVTERMLAEALGPETGRIARGKQLSGFLNGFIDLVFRHKGKWWIVDWKSNHLGNSADRYNGAALERAMTEHNYHLQYHLYAVALARYLATASGGTFNYDQDFGGVLYLFVRGVDANGNGIYHARPTKEVMEQLEAML